MLSREQLLTAIPTEQLQENVGGGFRVGIGVGGELQLRTETPYRGLNILVNSYGEKTRLFLIYKDYHFLREPMSPGDILGDDLFWKAALTFDEQGIDIDYLIVAGMPIVSSGVLTSDYSRLPEGWRQKLIDSFKLIPDLIDKGIDCAELAFRGKEAPIHGYHIRSSDLAGNEELTRQLSDSLLIARLRLPDIEALLPAS